jgi:hypothetical protein
VLALLPGLACGSSFAQGSDEQRLEKEIAVSRLTAGVVGNEHSAERCRVRWLTKNEGLQEIEWVILGIIAAEKLVDRGFLKL